ncbi:hypothetical protein BKA57DRAFT_256333 [Linnemannia elongata]|nr:hypothetical protein BKA57DRAFT_256333 [Linnemannia elongata]
MESDNERFQCFRRGGAGPGQDSRVVSIEAFYHPDSGKHVVYWIDIQDAFPNIDDIVIMKEARVISRARNTSGLLIEPRCINYHHNVTLEVVSEVFSTGAASTLSPPLSVSTIPDLHMDKSRSYIHTQTASTASSHLKLNNAHSSQAESTLPVPLGEQIGLMSPPNTNNDSGGSKEQVRNNNDLDNQQTQRLPQWTTCTAGGSHSVKKVAVSISTQSSLYTSQSNNASSPSNGLPKLRMISTHSNYQRPTVIPPMRTL